MLFTDIDRVPHVNSLSSTGHVALTVFPKGEAGRSPQLKKKEARHIDEQLSAIPRTEFLKRVTTANRNLCFVLFFEP